MRSGIIAFVLGNISFLYLLPLNGADLRSFVIAFFLSLVLQVLLYKAQRGNVSFLSVFSQKSIKALIIVSAMFFCGYCYTAIYVNQFYPALDLEGVEGKNLIVTGFIDSIPEKTAKKASFEFVISARQQLDNEGKNYWDKSFHGKVKLNWYKTREVISTVQKWQLTIRVKKPNGLLNGGFDYEKWLYQNRIAATGYVRQGHRIDFSVNSTYSPMAYLSILRQKIADKLDNALADHPYKGLIKALTIGLRNDIDAQQWQQFLNTGTNHLIAISGLHISLMSGLVWLLVNSLWRAVPALSLRCPAHYVASFFALLAAFIYASLAGFALPTQRALIMLWVIFSALLLKREFLSSTILLLALWIVVLFDPLSALSASFWLSFIAVAVIFFSLSSRLTHQSGKIQKILQLGWLQIAIFIGLSAPLVILFQQFSLISPLANFIAVPLMSLIIVPMTFLAILLLFIYEPLGQIVFQLLQWPVDGLFLFLDSLTHYLPGRIYLSQPTLLSSVLLIFGSIWLLMPRGWPGRWLGLLLFLPVFLIETEKIPQGQMQMTLLDVGQGLAILLRTQNHTLLYDTGDKYSESFNMADAVIIPYMRSHGLNKLDTLIVSHSDRDHAGSFQELVNQLEVKKILAGEPELLSLQEGLPIDIIQCRQGQQWQWDQVLFRVLSPVDIRSEVKNNNRSCVIYISNAAQQSILLTGDIEKNIEQQLLKNYPELTAEILQVAHHGSKTSSSIAFLQQIQPKAALFSFGYKNRFHHPAKKVVQRYKQLQIKLYNTNNGAIEINSNIINNSFSIIEYRVNKQMFWHRELNHL